MAINKALSAEDGSIGSVTTLQTSRRRAYKDIDLTFASRPSGDIYKKVDAAAVKQAVKNIVSTNMLEKPFNSIFGADVRNLLFELADDLTANELEQQIAAAIITYEPRAQILNINASLQPDQNSVNISITFKVINVDEIVTFSTTLSRLR